MSLSFAAQRTGPAGSRRRGKVRPDGTAPDVADDVEVETRGRTPTVAAWALLAGVCAASALAGRLCYLGRPFDSDAAMFVYMGKLVADGGRVGRDVVDNKFPTVGLVMAGPWRAVGANWAGYVLLGAGLSAVAAAAIGAAAGRGRVAAGLFAVVFLNLTPAVFGGFQLETPICCFGCLAAMAAVRAIDDDSAGAACVAGLAAGCGALLKPTGVGVLGALAVGAAVRGRPVKGMAAAAAGLALPLAFAAVYLNAAGLWGELPVTAARLSAYARGSVVDAVAGTKLATVAALVGWPLVVGRLAGGRALARSPHLQDWLRSRPTTSRSAACGFADGGRSAREAASGRTGRVHGPLPSRGAGLPAKRDRSVTPAVFAFAGCWLAVELLGVVAQRRMYAYHFLPLVPPAALLFGLTVGRVRPAALLAALAPAAALSWVVALHVVATPTDGRLPVGRYLLARAAAGDAVWADDYPRLLLETGLRPGSRQALTFLFANDDATAAADSAQIVADLAARRPAFVVLPADLDRWLRRQTAGIVELSANPTRAAAYVAGWRRVERYTLGHYRREATVGDAAVYRRSDAVTTADVR